MALEGVIYSRLAGLGGSEPAGAEGHKEGQGPREENRTTNRGARRGSQPACLLSRKPGSTQQHSPASAEQARMWGFRRPGTVAFAILRSFGPDSAHHSAMTVTMYTRTSLPWSACAAHTRRAVRRAGGEPLSTMACANRQTRQIRDAAREYRNDLVQTQFAAARATASRHISGAIGSAPGRRDTYAVCPSARVCPPAVLNRVSGGRRGEDPGHSGRGRETP